jgi:hypothetical protein
MNERTRNDVIITRVVFNKPQSELLRHHAYRIHGCVLLTSHVLTQHVDRKGGLLRRNGQLIEDAETTLSKSVN